MDSVQLDLLWDWGDPAKSERQFREVGTPEAMTQVARALGLQKRYGEAHKTLDAIEPEEPVVAARLILERGRLHNDLGEKEEALQCFRDALTTSRASGADYYAVDAAHMIAICENNLDAHLSAIELASNSPDIRAQSWDASLLNNLGWTKFEQGDFEGALECFRSALEKRLARGEEARSHVAKWCVARALRALKRFDDALEVLYPLLETGGSDGYVYDEIGENLLAKSNLEGSRPYFDAAARLLPPEGHATLRRAELGRAGSFAEIGNHEITLTRTFAIDNEVIWEHIVNVLLLPKWLGTVVGETNSERLVQGMRFELQIDNDPNDVVHCEVRECVEPRILVINWNDTSLAITVVESTLTLTHAGVDDVAFYGAAWHSALDLLSHVMAGGSRQTFTENFDALLPEYRRLISRTPNREIR